MLGAGCVAVFLCSVAMAWQPQLPCFEAGEQAIKTSYPTALRVQRQRTVEQRHHSDRYGTVCAGSPADGKIAGGWRSRLQEQAAGTCDVLRAGALWGWWRKLACGCCGSVRGFNYCLNHMCLCRLRRGCRRASFNFDSNESMSTHTCNVLLACRHELTTTSKHLAIAF